MVHLSSIEGRLIRFFFFYTGRKKTNASDLFDIISLQLGVILFQGMLLFGKLQDMQNTSLRTAVRFPYLSFYIGLVNVVTVANSSVFYTDSLLSINPTVGQKRFRLNRCCCSFLREVKCVHRKRERS